MRLMPQKELIDFCIVGLRQHRGAAGHPSGQWIWHNATLVSPMSRPTTAC